MVNDARLGAPGEPETLWRLYQGAAAVGFVKNWGDHRMWSKTGAASAPRSSTSSTTIVARGPKELCMGGEGHPVHHRGDGSES